MQNQSTGAENRSATPMLQQYWQIKTEHSDKDTILFFRLGDFYEMFYDDAKVASRILDITLTSRNKNDPNPVPLCGIPYHAADTYIAKLLEAGKKIAICEQVEDPKLAKGVVKREVIKIITPGVVMEQDSLSAKENNYLVSITSVLDNKWALSLCDVSTGELQSALIGSFERLSGEIARIAPREIILPRSLSEDQIFINLKERFRGSMITVVDDPYFDPKLDSNIDISKADPVTFAAVGAVLRYIKYVRKDAAPYIKSITPYMVLGSMVIDDTTIRNLELLQTMSEKTKRGSLLWLLDRTKTSMGARTIRRWMLYPLQDIKTIEERLFAVERIKDNYQLSDSLKDPLSKVSDVERILARVVSGTANARDLVSLKDSLKAIPNLKAALKNCDGILGIICSEIDGAQKLVEKIESTLVDEPPLSIKEGGIIRSGISKDLDELKEISTSGKDFIARLEAKERERTGISSLKVRYNRVFGYYIEVTHTNAEKVPEDYIRKQTLTNAERYITPELKTYEEKVLTAEERIKAIEYEIFQELRRYAASFAENISKTAEKIGALDAILSLAEIAKENRYVRPKITDSGELKIVEGRHPIIEQLNPSERFVPNDLSLDMEETRLMIITGPNMAGKSTVMRQTALIVLMAQMGSFVPATEATIGIVDRIFTRVGASDNLIHGQSTFMVEMNEAGAILREATKKSLILIDEIGRGTSTYDGVSIAWAVAEYLYEHVGAKTLFATHYHELTDLAETKKGIKNYSIAVKEWNDQIVFLRRLVPGAVNRSYGIQVARLAGLPNDVILKAKEILMKLEKGEMELKNSTVQMSLFEEKPKLEIIEKIKNLDTSVLTPIEALNFLHKLKSEI